MVDDLPSADVLAEIDREVDMEQLEQTLMDEGLKKFADPQKGLLALIAELLTTRTVTAKVIWIGDASLSGTTWAKITEMSAVRTTFSTSSGMCRADRSSDRTAAVRSMC